MFLTPTIPVSSTAAPRPRLAIALGDPAGIGAEVVLKALVDPATTNCDVTVIGSRRLLQNTYETLQKSLIFQGQSGNDLADPQNLTILDVPLAESTEQQIVLGTGNAASGAAGFSFLETAIAHTLAGDFQGIVTAPIAKSAWKAAGHHYPGQTELLAERAGVERFGMLFVARSPHTGWLLRTLLATTHIPLRQVPDALSPQLMTAKLDLLLLCLRQDFGIVQPRIAIAGLNPHSGEQGQLGHEEQNWLIPWIKEMGDRYPHIQLEGPVPPDTLWTRPGQAWFGTTQSSAHDAYLALYHDQGLIPVKLMAFDRAVNTTIGLPFVRTSPDHGTAFDIAGRGVADATSMKAALQLAAELVQQRTTLYQSRAVKFKNSISSSKSKL
ncbi:4-hydroxythreonine-4-phosphate dehydrogenase PdxA [Leptolyngbya sp. FACHB-671]|uniref:4-hydroxythreonine-4-phosphate dehydrogenase PdxA n=1 Tax=Leptolyngbya sp. FACHB-671 TaxID=2692812 RepID=UPI001683AA2B|nr:4-hydroxythreonine-4-phosphate dehydrogenase PdxA [Leptolyngbya sp. FACHB-671]MBD2069170.1 4-hydroxythreonine-4-phosphate dehydrogenase PdxA [Leptolyngbya sp. FACHB-671]